MRRLSGYVLALVGIVALVTAAAAQGSAVIPGKAVGDYQLGEALDPLVSTLGPLHSSDDLPSGNMTGYYWPLKRIGVIAEKGSKRIVALVVSLDDTYKTDRGVTIGSDINAFQGVYGKEDTIDQHQDDATYVYNKLGIAFVVDEGGALDQRVSLIYVFPPGQYKAIFTSNKTGD
ncbi:MAG TPA: hypothetical protein VKW09_03940 [bacterium]|nr:hypothetical protein [bacterium]